MDVHILVSSTSRILHVEPLTPSHSLRCSYSPVLPPAGEKGTAYTLVTAKDVSFAGDLVRSLVRHYCLLLPYWLSVVCVVITLIKHWVKYKFLWFSFVMSIFHLSLPYISLPPLLSFLPPSLAGSSRPRGSWLTPQFGYAGTHACKHTCTHTCTHARTCTCTHNNLPWCHV